MNTTFPKCNTSRQCQQQLRSHAKSGHFLLRSGAGFWRDCKSATNPHLCSHGCCLEACSWRWCVREGRSAIQGFHIFRTQLPDKSDLLSRCAVGLASMTGLASLGLLLVDMALEAPWSARSEECQWFIIGCFSKG
jgi:hypothetical protein